MEFAEPTTSSTKRGKEAADTRTVEKQQKRLKEEADPAETKSGREERKERGTDLMGKYTQK